MHRYGFRWNDRNADPLNRFHRTYRPVDRKMNLGETGCEELIGERGAVAQSQLRLLRPPAL